MDARSLKRQDPFHFFTSQMIIWASNIKSHAAILFIVQFGLLTMQFFFFLPLHYAGCPPGWRAEQNQTRECLALQDVVHLRSQVSFFLWVCVCVCMEIIGILLAYLNQNPVLHCGRNEWSMLNQRYVTSYLLWIQQRHHFRMRKKLATGGKAWLLLLQINTIIPPQK